MTVGGAAVEAWLIVVGIRACQVSRMSDRSGSDRLLPEEKYRILFFAKIRLGWVKHVKR